MRVAVTGGAGFLGRATIGALAEAGVATLAVDRQPAGGMQCDLAAGGARWPDDVTALVHLAGDWTPGAAPERTLDANLLSLAGALAACGDAVEHVVYVSSMSVYSPRARVPSAEGDLVDPDSVYGAMKLLGEHLCRISCARPLTILRLAQVYGPGAPRRIALYDWIAEARASGAIAARCAPELIRDHLHVRDAAAALVAAVRRRPLGTFNVGSGGHTMRALADAIAAAAPARVTFAGGAGADRALDAAAFTAVTGWTPQVALADGIRGEVEG